MHMHSQFLNSFSFSRLQKSKVNIKFVTNTTKESKRVLLERLHSIGFNVKGEEIFTSLTAARYLIEQRKLHPLLMVDEKALEDFEGLQVAFLPMTLRWWERKLLMSQMFFFNLLRHFFVSFLFCFVYTTGAFLSLRI